VGLVTDLSRQKLSVVESMQSTLAIGERQQSLAIREVMLAVYVLIINSKLSL
jgi:hypothetical protein